MQGSSIVRGAVLRAQDCRDGAGAERLIVDLICAGRGHAGLQKAGKGLPVHARDLMRGVHVGQHGQRLFRVAQPEQALVARE